MVDSCVVSQERIREVTPNTSEPLTASQIADLGLAASKMHGAERRAFQAEMALKYCQGSSRLTEF